MSQCGDPMTFWFAERLSGFTAQAKICPTYRRSRIHSRILGSPDDPENPGRWRQVIDRYAHENRSIIVAEDCFVRDSNPFIREFKGFMDGSMCVCKPL
jgi:hypothetical protein